ncbi:sialic acid TRAP transporter substrate-binding protein SiaP [Thalassotalea agarivorans]|uniref:Tripartite ATP-independent transporter solute receptor, DctP family n=1 Tax=Thalassotalea agarivorans TaxID=349064 RepID=A0A1I0GSZ5_THASX|nr:sialic acid TRAP transporter substrate-binding protein SiaP [Thalassotalea agarivorans]SET74451.1 tripartite ATP-independent transporter solute receptor, DctP family [Thalassotalea agarivorans]
MDTLWRRSTLLFIWTVTFLIGLSVSDTQAQETETRRLIWAHVYETSVPLHKWAVWAAEEIKKQTNGRYQIDVFPMSTLGKEIQLNQSLSLGTIDIVYAGTSFVAQKYPPLALSELPYMFRDYQHWETFKNSVVFEDMINEYKRSSLGNQILGNTYYGQRHLTSNFPVTKPAHMKNLKIRVPNAEVYKLFPNANGANPSPIAFSEAYLALQQGVVDAQENPLPTIQAKKFYEVNTHINLTGHILGSILTVASERLWQELSTVDKVIFKKVLNQAAQGASNDTREAEQALVNWFKQQGIQVHEVDRASFRRNTLPLHAEITSRIGESYYDNIQRLEHDNASNTH